MSEDSLLPLPDALLGSLYQSLAQPSLWPGLVRDITAFSGGTMGALQVRRLSPELTTSMVSWGVEPAFHQAYVEHHYRHDPHLQHAASLTEGQTLLSREVLPDEDFRRTPYYNEYCRPQGIRDLMGVMLVRDTELAVSFATYAPDSRSFEERDRRRLQRLVPHLSRVVKLTLEQEQRGCALAALEAAQHAAGAAILVVDRELRVHSSSGALEHWLGQPGACLEVKHGRLVARSGVQAQLQAAVLGALEGRAARLEHDAGLGQVILVAPAASKSCFVPRGLVNVLLMANAPHGTAPRGAGLCDLPPALRRVARLMARGAADKEIATELGMTLPSARTYAARVLKRTGAQSRRELMLRLRDS
jgi:hypothetical protein